MNEKLDGSVLIGTEIDDTGFRKDSEKMTRAMDSFGNTVKNTMAVAANSFKKQSSTMMSYTNKLQEAEKKAARLKQEVQELSKNDLSSDKVEKYRRELERARQKAVEMGAQLDAFTEGFMPTELRRSMSDPDFQKTLESSKTWQEKSAAVDRAYLKVEEYERELREAEQQEKELAAIRLEKKQEEWQKASRSVDYYKRRIEEVNQKEAKATTRPLSNFKKGLVDTASKFSLFNKAAKQGKRATDSFGKGLMSSFMMMLKFTIISKIISGITNSIKEGMNNLAQYSASTNKSLSSLKSSLTTLKNSLATAFAPVLNSVAPILVKLINLITKAVNAVGMFFAVLTGQKTFIKAKEIQEDYAASLNNTAGAAGNAEKQLKQLAGFDELNVMNKDTGSSGGGSGGGGGTSPSDMFEEVAIPNYIADFAAKFNEIFNRFAVPFKEWLKDLDMQPLIDAWDDLMEALAPLGGTLLDYLVDFWEDFLLPVSEVVIEDTLPRVLTALADACEALRVIFEKLRPAWEWVLENILTPSAKLALDAISSGFEQLARTLGLVAGLLDGDYFEEQGTTLGESLIDWIWHGIDQGIKLNPISWLPQLMIYWFAPDGTEGDTLLETIWNIIKYAFDHLWDFGEGIGFSFGEWLMQYLDEDVIANGNIFEIGWEIASGLWEGFVDGLKEIWEGISRWCNVYIVIPIKKFFGIYSPSKLFQELGGFCVTGFLNGLKSGWDTVTKPFSDAWTEIKRVFSNVGLWFKEKFGGAYTNIKSAFNGIGTWFGDKWTGIKKVFSNVGDWFKEKFGGAYTNIKNVFNGIGNFFGGIWNTIKNTFSGLGTKIGEAIGGGFKKVINGVLSTIEWTINNGIGMINTVLNLVPGNKKLRLAKVKLPRLATGTVVPPNAGEFAAILGDNKRETEVVSPLSTMKQALKEALLEVNGGQDQTVNVYLEGSAGEIFRVVRVENTKYKKQHGGDSAFA